MNKIKKTLILTRDLILLCILIFLIKIEFKKNVAFIAEHKNSLIHELDANFLEQLHTTQRIIHQLEKKFFNSFIKDSYEDTLATIKQQLKITEEYYKQNSPVLMLLGPIGTTAIVLKEKKLQTQLLDLLNQLGSIMHNIGQNSSSFDHAVTIDSAIEQNKKLLLTITAK